MGSKRDGCEFTSDMGTYSSANSQCLFFCFLIPISSLLLHHVPLVSCREQSWIQCLKRCEKEITRTVEKDGPGKKRDASLQGVREWAGCCVGGDRPSCSSIGGLLGTHCMRTPPPSLPLPFHLGFVCTARTVRDIDIAMLISGIWGHFQF